MQNPHDDDLLTRFPRFLFVCPFFMLLFLPGDFCLGVFFGGSVVGATLGTCEIEGALESDGSELGWFEGDVEGSPDG